MAARRVEAAPTIDGALDDPIWDAASRLGPFFDPYTDQATPDKTYAWIAYDAQAIYVAFRCEESRMDQIAAREITPGAMMEADDRVTLMIDPFNTATESGISTFLVNPLGTRTERIAGGRATKLEWRGDWQAAVRREESAWTVELRIPWRILNYPSGAGRNMTLNFFRYQGRNSVISEWSNRGAARRPELHGRWTGVNPPPPPAAKLEHLIYAAPEWHGGRNEIEVRGGVDVRNRFTPQFTGLVSLNPDFRNIENQIAGIDFTRSERFLADARPFFTEGGNFFEMTPMFSFARVFYSRRIQDFEVGAKAFGNLTPRLRVGALVTSDGPHDRDAVVRVSQILGPRGSTSLFATTSDHRGSRNRVFGGTFGNFWGNYGFNTQLASAEENGVKDSGGSIAANYSVPGLFHETRYSWVEPNFQPRLALVPFTDRRGQYHFTEHNNQYRTGPLKRMHAEWYSEDYSHYDGTPQAKGNSFGFVTATRSDLGIELFYNDFKFEGVPDRTTWLNVTFNESNRYKQFSVGTEFGEREGEDTHYLSFGGTYRAFKKVDMGLRTAALDFMGTTRQTIGTIGWEIDPARSLTGRFVEQDGNRNYYIAYRSAGFSGVEVFVIWGDPNALTFQRRLSLKLVWAF